MSLVIRNCTFGGAQAAIRFENGGSKVHADGIYAYNMPTVVSATGPLHNVTFRNVVHRPKVGRNDPCPCESGAKFKKCCGR